MSSTPLQSVAYPVYADPTATMRGGTPLILGVSKISGPDEYHVIVKLQLLQAYDRAIFELQQQLVHYKTLLEVLLPKPEDSDVLRLDSFAMNPTTVRVLDSIISAKVPASVTRGMDYEGEG